MKNIFTNSALIILSCFTISQVKNCCALNSDTLKNQTNSKYSNQILNSIPTSYRLPNTTKPTSYKIDIITKIHEADFEFFGTVQINVIVLEKTNSIVINAKNLQIISVNLTGIKNNDFRFPSLDFKNYSKFELLEIYSKNEVLDLKPGEEYILEISYKGELRDDKGFYKNHYENWLGEKVWIASTLLEPTDARHAFPCYDEPSLKSKFTISITHGRHYNAISNMPEVSRVEINEDLVKTTFAETPIMSTYSIAFVISNFENISSTDITNNFTQRVFCRPEKINDCKYALELATKIYKTITDYFGISLGIPKMDHVGVQNASSPAMENWGLIIYVENSLAINNLTSSEYFISNLEVIAHEYAHQLFGNLVTNKYWTWSWLNEGFATFYSEKFLDMIYPDLSMQDIFFLTRSPSYIIPIIRMQDPTRFENQAINAYVEEPANIMDSSFMYLQYYKAPAILKMFETAMGQKTFYKGVKTYLQKFQYSVVEEDDLFSHLQNAINENENSVFNQDNVISMAFKSWTNQEGFPLVTITRNYNEGTFSIEQKPFLNNEQQNNSLWWIPINFATTTEPNFELTVADFILPPIENFTVDSNVTQRTIGKDDWLIIDKQAFGYYHVNYDKYNWKLIENALKDNHKQIHKYNRVKLIKDIVALYNNFHIKFETLIDILSYLSKEKDYIVWASLELDFKRIFSEIEVKSFLKSFLHDLIRPVYIKIGYNHRIDDSQLIKFCRQKIVRTSCGIELNECLLDASNELEKIRKTEVKAEYETTYCFGLKNTTDDNYNYFLNRLKWTQCPDEQSLLINSLACSKNSEQLKKFFNIILDTKSMIIMNLFKRLEIIEDLDCFTLTLFLEYVLENREKYENVILSSAHKTTNLYEKIVQRTLELEYTETCLLYEKLKSFNQIDEDSNGKLQQIIQFMNVSDAS